MYRSVVSNNDAILFSSGARDEVHREHARQRGCRPRAAASPGRLPLLRVHGRQPGGPQPRRQHQDPPTAQHEPGRMEDRHRQRKYSIRIFWLIFQFHRKQSRSVRPSNKTYYQSLQAI